MCCLDKTRRLFSFVARNFTLDDGAQIFTSNDYVRNFNCKGSLFVVIHFTVDRMFYAACLSEEAVVVAAFA